MTISLIAAIGKNNELGRDNTLIWHMPEDMKRFREVTSGHPVIMGRKTFESLGRPLPKRRNIVITRDKTYARDGIEVAHSIDDAINLFSGSEEEVFIIGGAEIYKQSISLADKLDITEIDATESTADAFFPVIGPEWKEVSRDRRDKDEKNPLPYSFVIYRRES